MANTNKVRRKQRQVAAIAAASSKQERRVRAKQEEIKLLAVEHEKLKERQHTLLEELHDLREARDAAADAARTKWRDEHKQEIVTG